MSNARTGKTTPCSKREMPQVLSRMESRPDLRRAGLPAAHASGTGGSDESGRGLEAEGWTQRPLDVPPPPTRACAPPRPAADRVRQLSRAMCKNTSVHTQGGVRLHRNVYTRPVQGCLWRRRDPNFPQPPYLPPAFTISTYSCYCYYLSHNLKKKILCVSKGFLHLPPEPWCMISLYSSGEREPGLHQCTPPFAWMRDSKQSRSGHLEQGQETQE